MFSFFKKKKIVPHIRLTGVIGNAGRFKQGIDFAGQEELIKKAFSMTSPVRITVMGEEDLLVLPVCIHAPDNSIVLYGQPNEGLVLVEISTEIRNKVQTLLDLMN